MQNVGGQRQPITLRLRLRSWDVFADDLFPNHLAVRLDSWTGQPQMHRPKIVSLFSFALRLASRTAQHLRKEVIQPHLPIRLPCYDFTPVTFPTLDGLAGFGCE